MKLENLQEQKLEGIKVAIEIFNAKCRQLERVRHPNIFVKGQKELFSDWFEDGINYPIKHLGANDHPDCIIKGVGFELKSLKTNGQIQFNSTIPTGRFDHKGVAGECYYAIARYVEDRSFGQLEDFTICYGDFFNFNREWAFSHMNSQETNFGDYGDGVVRYRKMYSFPSPTKQVPGVSLILDISYAEQIDPNLTLEVAISRKEKGTNFGHTFYVYRHKSIIS